MTGVSAAEQAEPPDSLVFDQLVLAGSAIATILILLFSKVELTLFDASKYKLASDMLGWAYAFGCIALIFAPIHLKIRFGRWLLIGALLFWGSRSMGFLGNMLGLWRPGAGYQWNLAGSLAERILLTALLVYHRYRMIVRLAAAQATKRRLEVLHTVGGA